MKCNTDRNSGRRQPLRREPPAPNRVFDKFSAANTIADAGIAP